MNRPNRRTVLTGAMAALACPVSATVPPITLRAAPTMHRLLPDTAPQTPVWAYDGRLPGPEIRVPQGDSVIRRFINDLPQGSSVHWHGIRLPNAMDGVAGLTQPAVAPGQDFLYDFVVPDAGTYWYHPHNKTYEQMARGLYGPLIIEEAAPPEVDHDLTLMLDDWRLTRDGTIAANFAAMHDLSHGGRIGNWITVNGVQELTTPVGRNARLRLRLINAANARIFTLGMQGLGGWVVALDGMPLAKPVRAERVILAPAQRADLIVDVTADAEGVLYSVKRGGGYAVAAFPVTGTTRAQALPAPEALAPNSIQNLAPLEEARLIDLPMQGGAMGRMQGARLNGKDRSMRELVDAGMVWSLAGTAGMPDEPLATLDRGETVRIRIANDTAWPHAMHLHGHHFRETGADRAPGPWRDTLLVNRGETRQIAFVADNPGDWLLHCHMLEHAASGMMTWLRVR